MVINTEVQVFADQVLEEYVRRGNAIDEKSLQRNAEISEDIAGIETVETYIRVSDGSIDDVCGWLDGAGFGSYSQKFREQAIDGAALSGLTKADLKDDLGVALLGQRIALLQAIENLE